MKTGYIEGYYGKQLSFKEREGLIHSLADLKMTHYFYCPKEDPYHRMQWKEDYDQDFMAHFSALNKVAISNNIEVIFGLSPGNDFDFEGDYEILLKKYRKFIDLGINSFCLLFDDLFEINKGSTHRKILNRLAKDLGKLKLYTVPQIYCDQLSPEKDILLDKYLSDFLNGLNPSVGIFLTGPRVVSKNYPLEYCNQLKKYLGQRELIIWDNYYANDYCAPKIHLSEFCNLDVRLQDCLDGIMINASGSHRIDQIYLQLFASKVHQKNTKEEILSKTNLPQAFYNIQHLFDFEIKTCNPESDLENLEVLLWRWNDPLKIEMYTYLHQLRQLMQKIIQDHAGNDILLKRFNFKRGDDNER